MAFVAKVSNQRQVGITAPQEVRASSFPRDQTTVPVLFDGSLHRTVAGEAIHFGDIVSSGRTLEAIWQVALTGCSLFVSLRTLLFFFAHFEVWL